jgi:hypothetical protein
MFMAEIGQYIFIYQVYTKKNYHLPCISVIVIAWKYNILLHLSSNDNLSFTATLYMRIMRRMLSISLSESASSALLEKCLLS